MLDGSFAHNPRTLLYIAPYLRSRSVDPVEIFRKVGVSPAMLLDANGWVPRELCFSLGNTLYAATGERFPGAAVGARFKFSDLGAWGIAVSGAATLREACKTAASAIGLLHQGTDLTLQINGRYAQLRFAFTGRSRCDHRQHVIGSLAVLRSVALLAGVPEAVGAQFAQPYERAGDRLEETFGPLLAFGSRHDAIVIDREILDLALPAQNGNASEKDPIETPAKLAAFVRTMLPYGDVSVDYTAGRLSMSTRTLQRRLRDWGFSFEEILDDIRRLEAIRRLAARGEPVMEIAFALGYSEQAHFTRAFRRWTGMGPREFRQQLSESYPKVG